MGTDSGVGGCLNYMGLPSTLWDLVLSYCFYENAHNFSALKAGGEKKNILEALPYTTYGMIL